MKTKRTGTKRKSSREREENSSGKWTPQQGKSSRPDPTRNEPVPSTPVKPGKEQRTVPIDRGKWEDAVFPETSVTNPALTIKASKGAPDFVTG